MYSLVIFIMWNGPLGLLLLWVSKTTEYNTWAILGIIIVANVLGYLEGRWKESRRPRTRRIFS